MDRLILSGILAGIACFSIVAGKTSQADEQKKIGSIEPKRVLLIGASVGKDWNMAEIPQRTLVTEFSFESIADYQFDKSQTLEEVLMRPKRKFRLTRTYLQGFFKPSPQKPDLIILKECAAYFPGDMEQYKLAMTRLIQRVRGAKIACMVATVVPVTEEHAKQKTGRMKQIMQFNDWLREYAQRENIALLDFEAVLRISSRNRHLQDKLAIDDGLHLNRKAYALLDNYIIDALRRHKPVAKN